VQVDRRITATMHAWNVASTDQTPTLERVLRLVYTSMFEQELGLPKIQHLIDFNAHAVRDHLIGRLHSPLVQKEWREIQQLRATDWRAETLSTKNRLFRLLTSPTLARFMGIPERTLNLKEIMDEGKILLVNLAPSDHLSHENALVFGALLVNEFFEHALRRQRDRRGKDPQPYYLYMDEFQNFVSLDIAEMLDQVRKFGLFLVMAHQRFGQLDESLIDAVLTNCGIRAVFGGLPAESARVMAQEMFISDLDAKKLRLQSIRQSSGLNTVEIRLTQRPQHGAAAYQAVRVRAQALASTPLVESSLSLVTGLVDQCEPAVARARADRRSPFLVVGPLLVVGPQLLMVLATWTA
jgi:hypothetical protein